MENVLKSDDIKAAVKMVIREYDQELKEKKRRDLYHNTYILMKKYPTLKAHINDLRDDINIEEEFEELEGSDVWVASIAKSKFLTLKMLAYIESALKIVKKKHRRESNLHEYKAFEMYFFEGKKNEEIMAYFNCGKNTPKQWSDKVLREISDILWGYDAFGVS